MIGTVVDPDLDKAFKEEPVSQRDEIQANSSVRPQGLEIESANFQDMNDLFFDAPKHSVLNKK